MQWSLYTNIVQGRKGRPVSH